MKHEHEPTERSLDALGAFRQEMWELKAEEESGEAATAHFSELNPDELTEGEGAIWEKLGNHALSNEEFSAYRTKISREGNASQKHFVGFIGNKLMIQQLEDEREEKK
ncbi:MAG: hypothetical protein HYS44_01795 [Candidatus Niyogibacteria bacterium]|nr:hypothetical protein [Candidatus Niyogibacteria bacterium]